MKTYTQFVRLTFDFLSIMIIDGSRNDKNRFPSLQFAHCRNENIEILALVNPTSVTPQPSLAHWPRAWAEPARSATRP